MHTNFLVIGDPHIQIENTEDVNMALEKILEIIPTLNLNYVVILGDVLHTHEKINSMSMNKAYEFIDKIRQTTNTIILVGNHDMYCNKEFLNDCHWMNGMKEWDNVTIVDKVVDIEINKNLYIFVPYVYPGKFMQALETRPDLNWKGAQIIFAHQEFFGCKMGAIISEEGDKWDIKHPYIISGHIHSNQTPQANVYYPGSMLQHAFGESEKNIIAHVNIFKNKNTVKEIDLKLPRKKIVYMDVHDLKTYEPSPEKSNDKLKLTISGNTEEFKSFKKTEKYKKLVEDGVKVVFKQRKMEVSLEDEDKTENINFNELLYNNVKREKDKYLLQAYELVINNRNVDEEDILFI